MVGCFTGDLGGSISPAGPVTLVVECSPAAVTQGISAETASTAPVDNATGEVDGGI